MRLLALLLLCISCNAYAVEKYGILFEGEGKVNKGWFTTGDEVAPGLFQIDWMAANVGVCNPDPDDADAQYNCFVNIAGEGFYDGKATFNPLTGAFSDSFGSPSITLQSWGFGHGYVQLLSPDAEGVGYWNGNTGTGSYSIELYDISYLKATLAPQEVPEPLALALLPLIWFAARRAATASRGSGGSPSRPCTPSAFSCAGGSHPDTRQRSPSAAPA